MESGSWEWKGGGEGVEGVEEEEEEEGLERRANLREEEEAEVVKQVGVVLL